MYTAVWIMIIVVSLIGSSSHAEMTDKQKEPSGPLQGIEEKWGVKVLTLRQSAGGYMLDFRYRVTNAEKAAPLFDRTTKPYLVDQATGATCMVPESSKIGALRQTRKPMADRNYFIIFANPGKYIKKGSRMTLIIGDFRIENLIVE